MPAFPNDPLFLRLGNGSLPTLEASKSLWTSCLHCLVALGFPSTRLPGPEGTLKLDDPPEKEQAVTLSANGLLWSLPWLSLQVGFLGRPEERWMCRLGMRGKPHIRQVSYL